MLRIALRSLAAHKLRLLLTAAAVFLGVAFVTGMLMLTNTLDRTFTDIFESGAQDVLVTRTAAVSEDITQSTGDDQVQLISQDVVDEVAAVEGVKKAGGAIFQNGAYLLDASGEVVGGNGPPSAGVNWQPDPDLAVANITQGRAPEADREIVVDEVTFPKLDIPVGDEVTMVTPSGRITVDLVGVFKYGETGGLAGATITAFTPDRAQQLFTEPGQWQSVEIAAADGFTDQQVADNIATALGDRYTVKTRAQQVEESTDALRQGLGFITYALVGFAGISLFVAAFLIYNTFAMLVAQRGREMALLRAVGVSRRQVLTSVLLEALVLALVSAVIGIGLGYVLAVLLVALLGQIGLALTSGVELTVQAVVWAAILAVVVTVASALLPALRAARTPPIAALREAATPVDKPGKVRTALGTILLVASLAGLASAYGGDPEVQLVALSALGLLIAVVMLSPLLAIAVAKLASAVMGAAGVSGRLAGRNAERGPRRVAATASALLIGLALVTTVAVVVASARESINQLIDRAFGADYVVATATGNPFSTNIATGLREVPEVEFVVSQSAGPARVDGEDQLISAVGGGPVSSVFDLNVTAGEVGELTQGTAIADSEWAADAGVSVGDRVTALFPSGQSRSFTVQGIFEPPEAGLISGLVIPKEDYRAVGGASQDTLLYVVLDPDADPATALPAVEAVTDENPLLQVLDQASIKEQNSRTINQLLYLIYGMLALSILIAALGVVNTMALSVLERTREIGLLRAVGASRRQVRRMIRWEAVLVAVTGALAGILVGLLAGTSLRAALSGDGIEILVIPMATLLVILVLAIVIGVLAAVLPARRAARLDILAAIADE
ncbi:MAG: FtsX-like permease family protein [Candidatus Nanopelagicales bacterium]|nr:FtsX-like permease family protein [Candidatus Nanopelagicales bacterium]